MYFISGFLSLLVEYPLWSLYEKMLLFHGVSDNYVLVVISNVTRKIVDMVFFVKILLAIYRKFIGKKIKQKLKKIK